MSLLGDVRTFLENNSKLVIVGIDYHHVFGSFNTHVFRIAPVAPCSQRELESLLASCRSWLPESEETGRISFFFDQPNSYGSLLYKETIGKEKVIRTFSVDDASGYNGKEYTSGLQEPVEQELVRTIKIMLYPTVREARRSKHGLTVYEVPPEPSERTCK